MPVYAYRARDKEGHLRTADVEAEDKFSAASAVNKLGYSVISMTEKTRSEFSLENFLERFKRVRKNETVFFSRQLSALLRSGIPLVNALGSIAEQSRNKKFRSAVELTISEIESGSSFSEALSKSPLFFSELFVAMVEVGESSGSLDSVLDRVAKLNAREIEINSKVRAALTYPSILVLVAAAILVFLLVNIVPKFVVVFETYGAELPLATTLLLFLSNAVRRLWLFFLIAGITIVLVFRHISATDRGKYLIDSALLKMPFWGDLYLKAIVGRFTRTFGVLFKSGVPLLETLRITKKVVGNTVIAKVIEDVRIAVIKGDPLTEPFKVSGVFPPTVVQMVSLGEQSGKLDDMMLEVGDFYDNEVENTIRNMATILEPVLLLFMGAMVAFIALSVLLPIFNLVRIFRQGV